PPTPGLTGSQTQERTPWLRPVEATGLPRSPSDSPYLPPTKQTTSSRDRRIQVESSLSVDAPAGEGASSWPGSPRDGLRYFGVFLGESSGWAAASESHCKHCSANWRPPSQWKIAIIRGQKISRRRPSSA